MTDATVLVIFKISALISAVAVGIGSIMPVVDDGGHPHGTLVLEG